MNRKMKLTVMGVFLALVLTGAICGAPKITIVAPNGVNGGEKWRSGTNHDIVWTYQDIPGGTMVKLVLFRGGTAPQNKLGNIIENIPIGAGGAGKWQWKAGTYEGGSAPVGDGYRIRIRDMNGQYPEDDSDNPFSITPPSLTAPLHEGVTEINPIRIDDPTKESVWTIGETHHIHWETTIKAKYPLSIFLVSADHKIPIVDIGKTDASWDDEGTKYWTVTDNLYTQEYCIRITSADREYEAHSKPFHVIATIKTPFAVEPSIVANKCHWVDYHEEGYNVNLTDTSMGTLMMPPVPDPGGKIVKYGFQWYKDSDNYERYRHRSFVFFDLAGVISQLKHKATVKMASFEGHTTGNSPQVCNSQVWCLDAQMDVGNASNLYGQTFASFPKHYIGSDKQVRIWTVQRWLDNPSSWNHGLVIKAEDEGPNRENCGNGKGQCVRLCTWILKLEIEEKLTK